MEIDLQAQQPLITTSTTESDVHEPDEKIPSSSIIIPLSSHARRSLVIKDNSSLRKAKREKLTKCVDLAEISSRLAKRTKLQRKCCLVNDMMCLLALPSIVLMIVTNELTFVSLDHRQTNVTWFMKLVMTISTFVLILLLIYYHYLNMVLHSINKSLRHWYVGITGSKIFQIIAEICICTVHPFPRGFPSFDQLGSEQSNVNSTLFVSGTIPLSFISTDVALGLPMFARLYLLCRAITFHSHFLQDSSSRSIGYLNKVPINFFFVVKAYLEKSPTSCLLIFCILIIAMGSWSLRACNYTSTYGHLSIWNSMWLFFTLFTSVGYGDIIPTTYCGRTVATLTALTGVTVTAFLIAVLSQKLLLSRWEKYILNFVLNIELAKSQKYHAANIIKYGWRMWHLRKTTGDRSIRFLVTERKFFESTSAVREIKQARLQLPDNVIGLPEIMTMQRETNQRSIEAETKFASHEARMDNLEKMFKNINDGISSVDGRLSLILEKTK